MLTYVKMTKLLKDLHGIKSTLFFSDYRAVEFDHSYNKEQQEN